MILRLSLDGVRFVRDKTDTHTQITQNDTCNRLLVI